MTNQILPRKLLDQLEEDGLLLESDPRLPSVASIVAGEPIKGSWWGHPKGHAIFAAAQRLRESPDILVVKLVSGKLTYVHRKLWPSLLAMARSGDDWQTRGLPPRARALLVKVETEGRVRADAPEWRDAARELERRLLAYSQDEHTQTGSHAKWLESWEHLRRRRPLPGGLTTGAARELLEATLQALNARFEANGSLPWTSRSGRRGSPAPRRSSRRSR